MAVPEKGEAKDEVDLGKKTFQVFKKILLSVHGLTLVLSVIVFICGLVTNLNHLAYHEAWHASYGIYNGSVLSMVIGIILTAISILGKKNIICLQFTTSKIFPTVFFVLFSLNVIRRYDSWQLPHVIPINEIQYLK